MRSYTQYINNYLSLTDNSTTNQTLGGTLINDSIRTIYNIRGGKWWFLEDTFEILTLSNVRGYQVPNKFRKIMDVYVEVQGSGTTTTNNTIYMPEPIFDPYKWKLVLAYQMGVSDVPYFYYRESNQVLFAPVPASDGNVITVRGRIQPADLSFTDYTTGTITSVPYTTTFTAIVAADATSATLSGGFAFPSGEYQIKFSNGEVRVGTFISASTAVTWEEGLVDAATATITVSTDTGGSIITASGTTFYPKMVGQYIKITPSTASSNSGDGEWYEISTYFDGTHLGLKKAYEGSALSAATTAFTIGQMSHLPEAYDMAVVYRAAAIYWKDKANNAKAEMYWKLYDGGQEAGLVPAGSEVGGLIGQMIQNETETMEGVYIPPFASTSNIVNTGAWWSPWQGNASGF